MKNKQAIKVAKSFKKKLTKTISSISSGKIPSIKKSHLTVGEVATLVNYCNAIINKKMTKAAQIQWEMDNATRARLPERLFEMVASHE